MSSRLRLHITTPKGAFTGGKARAELDRYFHEVLDKVKKTPDQWTLTTRSAGLAVSRVPKVPFLPWAQAVAKFMLCTGTKCYISLFRDKRGVSRSASLYRRHLKNKKGDVPAVRGVSIWHGETMPDPMAFSIGQVMYFVDLNFWREIALDGNTPYWMFHQASNAEIRYAQALRGQPAPPNVVAEPVDVIRDAEHARRSYGRFRAEWATIAPNPYVPRPSREPRVRPARRGEGLQQPVRPDTEPAPGSR